MQHLSALDALFLYLETPEMPMHVGSLMLFEKPKGHRGSFFNNIRVHIEGRMHLAPLFSRKLAFMPLDLANPVWVKDERPDIGHHIKRLVLPRPGTQAQLDAAVARLHEGMLDRDRPLWEFTVIEGVHGGLVGFYAKIHHAALDGQGGVALAQATLDPGPVPRVVPAPGRRAAARRAPSTAKLLGAAFRHTVAQYGQIIKAVPGVLRLARDAGVALLSPSEAKQAGAPSEQGTGIPVLAGHKPGDTLERIAKSLLEKIPGGIAFGPRTPFNLTIGSERDFVGTRIPLAEAKAIARHFGAKLNDVALATCAAAMRAYFAGDKSLFAKPMICAVPASLRAPGDGAHGNLVTMMLVNMATHIANPRKRLAAIVASSAKAKAITGGVKSVIPTDMPSLGVPWLIVGTYKGTHTVSGYRGDMQLGVQLIIASVENGVVKGTATRYGRDGCGGTYPMEGTYDSNKLVMRATAKGGTAGDCPFGFDVVQEGNKLVGKNDAGRPIELSK